MVLTELLSREFAGLTNPWAYLILVCGSAFIWLTFFVVYLTTGGDWFKADGTTSEYERTFWHRFIEYIPWALAQQIIVFTYITINPVNYNLSLAICGLLASAFYVWHNRVTVHRGMMYALAIVCVSLFINAWANVVYVSEYEAAVCFFFCVHTPNVRLMVFTFLFSMLAYYAYFFGGFTSLTLLSVLHAWGGTCYSQRGWDMRVLWAAPRD